MNAKERREAWTVDQLDPDNWLVIPDFGVSPRDVVFSGFAYPVVTPKSVRYEHYQLQQLIRAQLRTARTLVRQQHHSQSEVRRIWLGILDLIGAPAEAGPPKLSAREESAAYYSICISSLTNARNWIGGGVLPVDQKLCLESVTFVANVIHQWVGKRSLASSIFLEEKIRAIQEAASHRGRKAADALHSKVGGSREKQAAIRSLWATGKFSSRDDCADQEYQALGMSYSAARRALRNTPDPA
jgi:hypothetical protein